MKMVVSMNWLNVVDRLFLSQRYFPLVFSFSLWKAQTSWNWLMEKAMKLAITILSELPKIKAYCSCPSHKGLGGTLTKIYIAAKVNKSTNMAMYTKDFALFFPCTSATMSVIKKIRGMKKTPTGTLIPNKLIILIPKVFAKRSAAMKNPNNKSVFNSIDFIN